MATFAAKEHIISALKKGVRLDGRKPDEYRPLSIETNVSATAEGSAKVTCGDTVIIAGVKMNTGTPYPDTPEEGVLIVNGELSPISNPRFEPGPPSIESIELSRVIDRGIRESKTIDVKNLCVRPRELVWLVNVDLNPLNADGNLIDMGALAAIAALKSTFVPKLVNDKPDYKGEKSKDKLPISVVPIPVTVVKVGETLLVDPTDEEMDVADCRLTVTTEEDGTICAMQKGGEGTLKIEDVEKMLDLATVKAKELRSILDKAVN